MNIQSLLQSQINIYIIVFFITSVVLTILLYIINSIGLYKLSVVSYCNSTFLAFLPFFCNYLLGEIAENLLPNEKLTKKYFKYVFMAFPIVLLIPKIGTFVYIIGYLFIIFYRIYIINKIKPSVLLYIFGVICPGISFLNLRKTLFNNLLETEKEKRKKIN